MDRFYIRLLLDDSVPLYPDDAAGCLLLEGDGSEARTDYGSVDLRLVELIDGLEELDRSSEAWVDFTGERVSLRLFRDELGEGVEYREILWRFPSGTVRAALLEATDELLSAFAGFRPFAEEGNLRQIEEWSNRQDDLK